MYRERCGAALVLEAGHAEESLALKPTSLPSVKLTLYLTSTQYKVGQVAERLKAHAWKACIR